MADHVPPCSLTRSESPAQLGQAMMSPEPVRGGSSISCLQPLQCTLTMPTSIRATMALQLSPSSRISFPRSKPTTTSPSITVTGVAL